MSRFIQNLKFIFMPHYWLMNGEYSNEWDNELNKLLDIYDFTKINEFTAYLGNTKIWINNYPYACFTPYYNGVASFRPSRQTIYRANKKLKRIPKADPYSKYKELWTD